VSHPRPCERCGQPFPGAASDNICPRCLAQLGQATWLGESATEATEATADEPQPLPLQPGVLVGTCIGPYRLLEQIGEGGFGEVWVADQEHPIRRRVALKILKSGVDSRQVVARFQSERQTLALMEHPHIAQVFDAGVANCGRPYFVMELLRGRPITIYSQEKQLGHRHRTQLLIDVCHAVHHAHEKGVIHRDLKPSNILVVDLAEGHWVKVIDFGIAKAIESDLGVAAHTLHGQDIGTPAYMSPEQASHSNIDRRSDIFSLGIILYELLTGQNPFSCRTVPETLNLIQHVTPVPPHFKRSSVSEDLSAVCMKSLEKTPARRYQSPRELAQDLARALEGVPVIAADVRWTQFARTLWADPAYAQRYVEVADYIIPHRRQLFQIVSSFVRHFHTTPAPRICDLGCGDGALVGHLASAIPQATFTLVDGSPELLEQARQRLKPTWSATFVNQSFEAIARAGLPIDVVDFVVSSFALHHLTLAEESALFQCAIKSLKRGGWFLNVDVMLSEDPDLTNWHFELWRDWLIEMEKMPGAPGPLRGFPEKGRNNPDNHYNGLPQQLKNLMAAGFVKVDCLYRNSIFGVYCGQKPS
jgi:ubiquinone/menaquinone biosynthesis C-methylase UbiE/tRNA A-37 threonylcarbamoyl transferase component Bud32